MASNKDPNVRSMFLTRGPELLDADGCEPLALVYSTSGGFDQCGSVSVGIIQLGLSGAASRTGSVRSCDL